MTYYELKAKECRVAQRALYLIAGLLTVGAIASAWAGMPLALCSFISIGFSAALGAIRETMEVRKWERRQQ